MADLRIHLCRFLLLFLTLIHLKTGFCAPTDDLKIRIGSPVTAELKLRRGSLKGILGSLPEAAIGSSCKNKDGDCQEWSGDQQQLVIQNVPTATGANQCKTVVWLSQDMDKAPQSCWSLTDGSKWYGGGSAQNQKWPIATDSILDETQVTGGGPMDTEDTNNIHNRLWFSTAGVAIKVEDDVPLFVTVEGGQKLCFKADNSFPYRYDKTMPPTLSYAVCYGNNLAELHRTVMSLFFEIPKSLPSQILFSRPIWNTYPKYPTVSSATQIKEYASNIENSTGTADSLLLIGHGWAPCPGDNRLHTLVFPNPLDFVSSMKTMGLHLGLWVHPHVDQRCKNFQEGVYQSYFITSIKDKRGPATGLWGADKVATIDFTDPESANWYTKSLLELKSKYNIESFFFDRGQAGFLPRNSGELLAPRELQPDIFATKYVETAASLNLMSIVNVGRNTQKYPVLVRMPAKRDYAWTDDNIRSVIPSILQMGISGFPFILPEVVGGSVYEGDKPDRNLYIRWLELSALMPTMHFSVGPWEYDEEVVQIANDMLILREKYMATHIWPAILATLVDGSPIVRPVWWIAPDDPRALDVADQFLVGDSLLVAPIVTNSSVRSIYIPPGTWSNPLDHDFVEGPKVIDNFIVPLGKLAHFIKVTT